MISVVLLCLLAGAEADSAYERACLGEDSFACADGGCVTQEQYCDGRADCADGSDENFCPEHPPDERLCNATHQFLCRDRSACVSATWVCNGAPDCTDASDEANCTSPTNTTGPCKGFTCGDGTCISKYWACDGRYDCEDRSDEDIETTCRHSLEPHSVSDGVSCDELLGYPRKHKCLDSSFCLDVHEMCDGLADCRDRSDEGAFCEQWPTMCVNTSCPANITKCHQERTGARCVCALSGVMRRYDDALGQCVDVDDCLAEAPVCSHRCENKNGHFLCHCDEGYNVDKFRYLCYAQGPEAMLFFTTRSDIRYIKVQSKQQVVVATGIKQGHGVAYDGKYLYWVETAEGHQAVVRAQLNNVAETRETLVSLGLEDPGDIAVDWLGGNIYFSDSERGVIFVCKTDGSQCTTLKTLSKRPRFVTLDVRNAVMYWADYHNKFVIMRARMDGSNAEVLVDTLQSYATGLAIDIPNDRLYFVDMTIRVVKVDTKQVYSVFEDRFHHPYAITVFENTIYWSDWTSKTLQTTDKIHSVSQTRDILATLHEPVFDMHIYHPVLQRPQSNPCASHNCSHICLLASNTTFSCACPDGMLLNGSSCYNIQDYRPQYLIVGGGASFTRIQYDTLGNPEAHGTNFDIGRVQAMAYDNRRDVLYIYDATRFYINSINMTDFSLGVTHNFAVKSFQNVVDMDYDYVTDSLYILDADRRMLEVISLKNEKRAMVYRFTAQEKPISFCILPDYGRLLVAVVESEQNNEIHIDSMGLDGEDRQHLILNDLKGPHVTLRYSLNMDNVYVSDESSGIIDYFHPKGTGRETYRQLSTTVTSLVVTDTLVFWTDQRTPTIFWAEIHETSPRVRRMGLSIFPNNTHLYLQATKPPPDPTSPLASHPCVNNPCSDICVQTSHPTPYQNPSYNYSYKCLCPAGLLLEGHHCSKIVKCKWEELHCHNSNECIEWARKCDGTKDCTNGEDEELCPVITPSKKCKAHQVECNDGCINEDEICPMKSNGNDTVVCSPGQFRCPDSNLCLEHAQVCDKQSDCPDGADEFPLACDTLTCFHTEFMCASGSCILSSWRCDGDSDCKDGSDEVDCENRTCSPGYYQCRSGACVDMHRRCDGEPDCTDGSDEERCEEVPPDPLEPPSCGPGENSCELDKSICLPATAWFDHAIGCNAVVDCPGGTDEDGCQFRCAMRGLFECRQEAFCVSMRRLCNGVKDCADGSDETPDACAKVNKTSQLFPPAYPPAECRHGYLCRTGQCVEWRDVCDQTPHCFDGSDENGKCFTACENNTCTHLCQPTPLGAQCACPAGFELAPDRRSCADADECAGAGAVCAQGCRNTPGSFLCSCRHGYALRSDRRSCKATKGGMAILYASGYSVRSISSEGYGRVEYDNPEVKSIDDVDVNVARNTFYVTAPEVGQLIEVNGSGMNVAITNIGKPTKVAVEWVTGNIYFVDATPGAGSIRVCNFQSKRCAKLHKLPRDAVVTALVVSPESRRLYFCMERDSAVVWGGDLGGLKAAALALAHCAGLAASGAHIYVAGRQELWRLEAGLGRKELVTSDKHLQSPHSPAVFEDQVYVLSDNYKMNRCLTYGEKTCEPYIYRLYDAQTFVIRHATVQRDDLKNECEGFVCANVCVLGERGPKCVCDDGAISRDGSCPVLDKSVLPLFNGWPAQEFVKDHHVSVTLITVTTLLFALYLAVFVYYHCVYRPRKAALALPVRFQNQPSPSGSAMSTPTVEMPTTSGVGHEFVNPLQFVRNIWQRSFRSHRPIGTAGLTIEVPKPTEDLSDTESDMDFKDEQNLIK